MSARIRISIHNRGTHIVMKLRLFCPKTCYVRVEYFEEAAVSHCTWNIHVCVHGKHWPLTTWLGASYLGLISNFNGLLPAPGDGVWVRLGVSK